MLCPQMADEVVNIGINHPAYKVCRRSCPPTRNLEIARVHPPWVLCR